MKILLGISGSISAYKAADIANGLVKKGHDVTAIMTDAATKFITPLTLQSLTKNKVYTDVMVEEDPQKIMHIDLAKQADLVLIAPASANTIAKLAYGIADNMLTATLLAVKDKPVYFASAMNTNMYEHPATQKNIMLLKEYGYQEIEPRVSKLACNDIGKGALATTEDIIEIVQREFD